LLLFLEVANEGLRVIAQLAEQLLAMAMQLFDQGIVGHIKRDILSRLYHA
jgi:hypothetical protein